MLLRAERYLSACRDPEDYPGLLSDVQGYTFERACRFYREGVPQLTDPEIALLGANDRFFLLTELLGRKDVIHPWLYARCREVEAAPDNHLDLWARYHRKSTIISFAGSIQEIICDPEITIAIFSATNKIAKPFLTWIMRELETNERLMDLYPDVFWRKPRKESPWWSEEKGIVVKRQGSYREPTVNAYGLIDGMPTGAHFKMLIYDDLVTLELVSNEEMVRKTTERFEMSDNLGVGEETRKRYAGTRYSFADSYGVLLERGLVKPRIYPATDNGKLDGTPVFLKPDYWQEVKVTQRSTVAAQMLQNPLAGSEATFDPHTLRSFALRPRTMNVYIMGDPSQGIKSKTSDRTAIVAIGVDHNRNKFFLDGYCHRMKLTERWENLRNLYKRWHNAVGVQSVQVGWERYGMQSDLQYFEERMQQKDEIGFPIAELNWTREGDQSKKSRVQRLEPDFNRNAFYLPAKVWMANATWKDADGKPCTGPRTCLWSVDADSGKIEYRTIPLDPKQANLPMQTRPEREAKRAGEGFRLVEPIRRRDEDGNAYDLTRVLFEEFMFFPFTPHDDLIDAVSRIYDMTPEAPMIADKEMFSTPLYD